jgi:DNA ligase (NAD+)
MDNQEYRKLIEEVNRLRNEVHLFNVEEISEAALDDLKHRISLYESANPSEISPNSPNYVVAGGVLDGFTKVEHRKRMLSLTDIFNKEELVDWEKRMTNYYGSREFLEKAEPDCLKKIDNGNSADSSIYVVEPKIDGLAMSLIYKEGKLFKAITRGDGWVGEDVSANVSMIDSIPKEIIDKRELEVRGEVFLTKSDFNKLNQDIEEGKRIGKMGKMGKGATFANPRNAASGTLRQLNSSIVKERKLSFIAYYLDIL